MSLFGKKKQDDGFADPEPPVDLSAERKPRAEPPPPPPERSSKDKYGIDQVVHLMRRLPTDNIELVVRVLKETLESVKIGVPGLIKEAENREAELTGGISDHKKSISTLEQELAAKKKQIDDEIAAKRKAISELEAAHKEVVVCRERLNLSLKQNQVSVFGAPTVVGAPISGPPGATTGLSVPTAPQVSTAPTTSAPSASPGSGTGSHKLPPPPPKP